MFSGNVRRKSKKPTGNFVFRKRKKKLSGGLTRLEVRHHMELNPETDATRRQKRLRTAGVGVKVAAGLLFVMGLLSAGVIVAKQAFMENPRFLLKHISVVTDGEAGLSAGDLVQVSGLKEGMNLLSVSLVKVREQLLSLPQVKHCKVTRGYPGIVFLEVTQRVPVAWLECAKLNLDANVPGRGCLLDADGFVVPSVEVLETYQSLPVIEVAEVGRLVPGQKVDHPDVLAGLDLVKQHRVGEYASSLRLQKVGALRGYALEASYDNRMTVLFPRHGLERQVKRLSRIVALGGEESWNVAHVNLLVNINVPVKFFDSSEQPNALDRPAKKRETLARSY